LFDFVDLFCTVALNSYGTAKRFSVSFSMPGQSVVQFNILQNQPNIITLCQRGLCSTQNYDPMLLAQLIKILFHKNCLECKIGTRNRIRKWPYTNSCTIFMQTTFAKWLKNQIGRLTFMEHLKLSCSKLPSQLLPRIDIQLLSSKFVNEPDLWSPI